MKTQKVIKIIGVMLVAGIGVPELTEIAPQLGWITPEMIERVVNSALALVLLFHDFQEKHEASKNTLGLLK